jgi:DNA mismatch repair protein MutS2
LGTASTSQPAIRREALVPGARLRVRGFPKPVIFRRLDGSLAEIEAGPLRMKVAVDEITSVELSAGGGAGPAPALPSSGRANVTVTSQPGAGTAAGEINVIGMRVEEATERVDKYLDEAALANQTRVRIIHGHGTGALRKGLGEFLKSHPLVQRTSFETEEHGGKAITVVELRS